MCCHEKRRNALQRRKPTFDKSMVFLHLVDFVCCDRVIRRRSWPKGFRDAIGSFGRGWDESWEWKQTDSVHAEAMLARISYCAARDKCECYTYPAACWDVFLQVQPDVGGL